MAAGEGVGGEDMFSPASRKKEEKGPRALLCTCWVGPKVGLGFSVTSVFWGI